MSDSSDEKVQSVKRRITELIHDLDELLMEARESIEKTGNQTATTDDPPWVLQIAEQRDVLSAIVQTIKESRIES